jgi:broad specificity phosphatase PhoE
MRLLQTCLLRIGVLSLLILAGCTTAGAQAVTQTGTQTDSTFLIVRHAEKAQDGTADPPLSAAGVARAQALAHRLATTQLSAVYATRFRRTEQTAKPTADAHALPVTRYDPDQPVADFAATLRAGHQRGAVLIVGHSNTVAGIVSALCACRIATLAEDRYDALYTVRIDREGHATLDVGVQ